MPAKLRERLRDAAGLIGIASITAGAGLQFGLAVGLMVGGAFLVAFAAYDAWAAE